MLFELFLRGLFDGQSKTTFTPSFGMSLLLAIHLLIWKLNLWFLCGLIHLGQARFENMLNATNHRHVWILRNTLTIIWALVYQTIFNGILGKIAYGNFYLYQVLVPSLCLGAVV